jgi:hypothetical protein
VALLTRVLGGEVHTGGYSGHVIPHEPDSLEEVRVGLPLILNVSGFATEVCFTGYM